jgi:hypothetical protein
MARVSQKVDKTKPNTTIIKNYLDNVDLDKTLTLLEENTAINSLVVAFAEGLSTDLNKQKFVFTVLSDTEIFDSGRNNDVVYSLRGRLFYPIRLVFSRSAEKIRLKLSLYIPIKLAETAEAKKMEIRVIPVKAGTIFETTIATVDKKNLYSLANVLMKEVKLMTLTFAEDPEILEKFTDATIMQ